MILSSIINILIILVALVLIYLFVIIFLPVLPKHRQPIESSELLEKKVPDSRKEVSFKVGDETIRGYLYLPINQDPPFPCVVMSNGFGGTRGMVLENYALKFVEEGMAVLTYDYRHFGESDGEPRQLHSNKKQIEDLRTGIEYVRNREEIDSDKIALWGTSASGGYGLIVAAEDKDIRGIIAQCSSLDSDADGKLFLEREGYIFFIRLFIHAQKDKGRSRFGLSPHKIPIVGKPGTFAFIRSPGAFDAYSKLATPSFKNEVCARVFLSTRNINPIDYADKVKTPVLMQFCEKDKLVSKKGFERTTKKLEKVEVKKYPIGHFDIYQGENFRESVKDQIEFLKKNFMD